MAYEDITYDVILQRMLDRVPDNMDKREGSIIYDALAPAAVELQLMYIELDTILTETFADTAQRDYLVRRAVERGITPYEPTYAILKGVFTPSSLDIPIPLSSFKPSNPFAITPSLSFWVWNICFIDSRLSEIA